jgi:pSer/pThr/pTyr-binding forkhead associated (FHA) protein
VFVNGERVEWSTLADGDEIVIGRHHLHFCDVPKVRSKRPLTETASERV